MIINCFEIVLKVIVLTIYLLGILFLCIFLLYIFNEPKKVKFLSVMSIWNKNQFVKIAYVINRTDY